MKFITKVHVTAAMEPAMVRAAAPAIMDVTVRVREDAMATV